MQVNLEQINSMIYVIRNQNVMLDSDLAELYGVETKRLNEQVRRSIDRFPSDFMFESNSEELHDLRSQFATAKSLSRWNHKRRSKPMLFTENGVAMLSSVLNSKRAIHVNISIMRTFTKLRSFLLLENENFKKINDLEKGTNHLFRVVFERLDNFEEKTLPPEKNRRKISL